MNIVAPKISIIVPVYNAEKYIDRCLQSIIHQSFTDWELIIVNDGSTDKSSEICEYFAKQDKRIKVFHKKNEGVSHTRQFGLNVTKGEFIIQMDADDWADNDMLECMYNTAIDAQADLVISDIYQETDKGQIYLCQKPYNTSNKILIKELLTHLITGCYNKFIRAQLIKDNNIQFNTDVNFGEDTLFWINVLNKVPLKTIYINKAWYHYDITINPTSITKHKSTKYFQSLKNYIKELDKQIDDDTYHQEKGYIIIPIIFELFSNGSIFDNHKSFIKKYKDTLNKLYLDGKISKVNIFLLKLSIKNKHLAYWLFQIKNTLYKWLRN